MLNNTRTFSGDNPPTEGVSNKHDGTSNPNMGEVIDQKLVVEGNRYPRQKGSDSLTTEEAVLS